MLTSPQSQSVPLGQLFSDDGVSTLPLEHVNVDGQILGMLASIALTQRFANPLGEPIELTYRFAIPHRASLAEFALRIGDRSIESEIAPRQEAEALYQRAVEAGQRAGLTTEERPNLYTVRIGNVQPGETIVASYRYSLDLDYDGGRFELALPFGITPRYHRADEPPEDAAATDVVIAPPGSPVALLDVTVAIDAGVAIGDPESPSHQFDVSRLDDRRCVVKLVAPRVPNKDLVLRYRVRSSDGAVSSSCWQTAARGGDILYALFVPPPPGELSATVVPREYVFVLDRSGSMSGHPVAQARNALRACLRTLTAEDTFRILVFDNQVEWFAESCERALPFDDDALRGADAFLDGVEGRGGTDLAPALRAVIKLPPDPARRRVIVLLTDGAVSAEESVTKLIAELPRGDRLFCFGIGPSVNRYLLDRLARVGRGVGEVVGLDEDIEGAIIRFQDRLSFPVLTDVELKVSGALLAHQYPSVLPDLFAGQALQVVAQVDRSVQGAGPVFDLLGQRADEALSLRIQSPILVDEPLIRRLWGRKRIDALLESPFAQEGRDAIVALSLEHHILTPYTALVAIDRESVSTEQQSRKIVVGVPLPEGLEYYGFVGHQVSWLASPGAVAPASVARPLAPQTYRYNLTGVEKVQYKQAPDAREASEDDLLRWLVQAGPATDSGLPEPSGKTSAGTTRSERVLRALIRVQGTSGAWGSADEAVEWTAAAVVAFARAGHTPSRGTFRRPLQRALAWLQSKARTPLEQRFACWAQAEVAAADGKGEAVVQVRDEAAKLMVTTWPDLAQAVALRLEILANGSGRAPSQPPAQLSDLRAWAILGLPRESAPRGDLPPPWEACFAVG